MKNFINYLKKHGILEYLINYYELNESRIQNIIYNIIDNLRFTQEINNQEILVDLFGLLYEENVHYRERKFLGEIYTPMAIIKYILDVIGFSFENKRTNKKIIDISCGSGSFLIYAVKILTENLIFNMKSKKNTELSIVDYKNIISKVQENIYGVDINPIACILCQINIQYTLFDLYNIIRKSDKNYQFPIFKIFNKNALKLLHQDNSHEIISTNFDLVIGNPPYLFIRDIPKRHRTLIENSNFKTGKGQYDYYQLFIEIGIKLLKNQGYLGYIVPDSLLALSNRNILRKYIYNTTKIKEIFHTGPKFDEPVVSNIILILQKEESEKNRENNIIKLKNSSSENLYYNEFVQKNIKNWDFRFLINLNKKDIIILDDLNKKFPKLKDIIKDESYKIILSRGVELGKDGKVIYCKKCERFYPLPKKELKCKECNTLLDKNLIETIIFENSIGNKTRNFKPYIHSINRYQIKKKKFIDISKKGINYKDLSIYEDRIIIRQLSQNNLICATYDKNLSLTSQSFYNLKITQSPLLEFNLYILGLFNSQLLSYYFIKSFGSYKKLFPRILIEKIKQLPIKIPITDREREIAKIIINKIKELLILYDDDIQNDVDSLIFDLYGIRMEKRKYISNALKTA